MDTANALQGVGEASLPLIARVIGLGDQWTPASANVLSEHEIEALDTMPPQSPRLARPHCVESQAWREWYQRSLRVER